MARGDVRPIASNHRSSSRGYGRSPRESTYDDEGRGASKDIWEWFRDNFNDNPTHETKKAWLFGLDDDMCYQLMEASTLRYNVMDIAYFWEPGWRQFQDTRAHQLVCEYFPESLWVAFHRYLVDGHERDKNRRDREAHARAEESRGRWAAYNKQQEALRIEVARQDWESCHEVIDFTAGMLVSELNQSFSHDEAIGTSGEWIEDAVETYQDGSGFGYDTKRPSGIKLQITLALDLSNSMYYNGIHNVAAATFRDLGLALRRLKAEYPEDIFVSFYTFSEDMSWGNPRRGLKAVRLEEPSSDNLMVSGTDDVQSFAPFQDYRPSVIQGWWNAGAFDGTDTYFAPLFTLIEKWEHDSSDPGAVRLDIVLTDYVAEHKVDIEACDVIQERRNGNLQTVMLNFMPEQDWAGSTLPKRCFMMKVDKDNVSGILRNVLSEFVSVHI